ncbi:MAG: hypothetical protein U1F06_02575 [Steroidobacteraceae bacterium]
MPRALGQPLDRALEVERTDRVAGRRRGVGSISSSATAVASYAAASPRRRASTALTAMRCIQVEKRLRASKRGSARQAAMKASWVQSSATSRRPVMRRHRPCTSGAWRRYSRSKARRSPRCAAASAGASMSAASRPSASGYSSTCAIDTNRTPGLGRSGL